MNERTVLITGAASGIGLEMAKRFISDTGATVIAADQNTELLKSASKGIGKNYDPYTIDVSQEKEIRGLRDYIIETRSALDVLINNAGIAQRIPYSEVTSEAFDKDFGVNLKGPMLMVRYMAPLLEKGNDPCVLNIGSTVGNFEGMSPLYGQSKIALEKFTRGCTCGFPRIRHNIILPGVIETPIYRIRGDQAKEFLDENAAITPVGRCGRPEDIANAALFLCSTQASFINGASLIVDGGHLAANSAPVPRKWLISS